MGTQIARQGFVANTSFQLGRIPFVGEELQARFLEYRALRWECATLFIFRGQVARSYLARLDVRLVEGVDADDRARGRGRYLPSKELLPQIVFIV